MIIKEVWLRDSGNKARNLYKYTVEYIESNENGIVANYIEPFSNKKEAIKEINKRKKGLNKVQDNWYRLEKEL